MGGIYDIQVQSIDGKQVSLKEYQGQALLVVNVASECGLTSQYRGLQELYETYQAKSFQVLGFPCNQFGAQEPGSDTEIKTFCETKFHVTFPMFSKIDVNGPNTHPLYQYLKSQKKGVEGQEDIEWNFAKFLIDRNGKVVDRFHPKVTPAEISAKIESIVSR